MIGFKRIFAQLVFLLIIFTLASCSEKLKKQETPVPVGGVCISFDDYNVDNWHKYLPLFNEFNAKVTFYISNFNRLTPAQISKLHDIENHGHEIAFHTTNHPNISKLSSKINTDTLVETEIIRGLNLMRAKGFNPKNFAFPYGAHTNTLDNLFLRYFNSVRCLNGSNNILKSYGNPTGNKVIYSVGMDLGSHRALEFFEEHLNNAANYNKVFFMVGHNIQINNSSAQVPLGKLRYILQLAKNLNLKFYTVSQVTQ